MSKKKTRPENTKASVSLKKHDLPNADELIEAHKQSGKSDSSSTSKEDKGNEAHKNVISKW